MPEIITRIPKPVSAADADLEQAILRADRATAKASPIEALHLMGQPFPINGACTPAQPFGQSTGFLRDGTPVHSGRYVRAALERAAKVWKGRR